MSREAVRAVRSRKNFLSNLPALACPTRMEMDDEDAGLCSPGCSERAVSPERFGNPSFFCPRYTFALGMFFWCSGSPSLTQS